MKLSGIEVQQSMGCGTKAPPVWLHVPSMLGIQVGAHRAAALFYLPWLLSALCACGAGLQRRQQCQESRIVFCVDSAAAEVLLVPDIGRMQQSVLLCYHLASRCTSGFRG